MTQFLEDDSSVGFSTPIGIGGGSFVLNKYIKVTWDFTANIEPDHFDIVIYTGVDPSDEDAYVYPPIQVAGSERILIKSTNAQGTNNFRAAVRAVYYKG